MGNYERDAFPSTFPFFSPAARNEYLDQSVFGKLQPGYTNTSISPTDEATERLKIVVANSVNKKKTYADVQVDRDFLNYQESLHPFTRPLTYQQLTDLAYEKNYEVAQTQKTQKSGSKPAGEIFPYLLIALVAFLVLRGS
jgi:hypothetical protein